MAKKDDTQYLKERVNQQEIRKQQKPQNTTVVESSTTFLEDVTQDERDTSVLQKKLHKRAESADAADLEKQVRQQKKQEDEQAKKDDEKQQQESTRVQDRLSRAATVTSERVTPAIDRVGALPTVGGIGLLVLILVVILFTVVRVNPQGDTRMKQLWYMLNGRATIQGRQQVVAGTVSGASGNFGTTGASANTASAPSGLAASPNAFVPASTSFRDTSSLGF